jgi:hypothetical protein
VALDVRAVDAVVRRDEEDEVAAEVGRAESVKAVGTPVAVGVWNTELVEATCGTEETDEVWAIGAAGGTAHPAPSTTTRAAA